MTQPCQILHSAPPAHCQSQQLVWFKTFLVVCVIGCELLLVSSFQIPTASTRRKSGRHYDHLQHSAQYSQRWASSIKLFSNQQNTLEDRLSNVLTVTEDDRLQNKTLPIFDILDDICASLVEKPNLLLEISRPLKTTESRLSCPGGQKFYPMPKARPPA